MDKLQKYIDDNLRVIKLLPTVFFVTGVCLLSRHFYLFTKFNSIHSIPSGVYNRQIRLKGLIYHVNDTSELEIFHLPKIRTPFRSSLGDTIKLCIPVEHSELSRQWIKDNIHVGDRITFIPVMPIDAEAKLLAIVFKKWYFFRKDISYYLLANGMVNLEDSSNLPDNYRNKYVGAVVKAMNKKKGIWREESEVWKSCKLVFERIKRLLKFYE
uniref:TNase-like domain-containing protein n=1 Tax=Trichobilharzia regenti TaxID=157069 RepID=A0AA85JQI5_TRIRE|nr:unnamed protein product [Trichobilharzia regenti]CAH8825145.1 unnamed protein product [Trichobilharzia regenti]